MADFISPGRIEILGNHTDHNHGKVLVSAITLSTKARAEKLEGGVVRIRSEGYLEMTLSANDTAQGNLHPSGEVVKGVMEGFKRRGLKVGGFSAEISSNVPTGAGVSSSASFELIIAEILNVFYNDGKIDKLTLAKIAQFAENVYMKKPCGLLDQSGIAFGGVTNIDFSDIENPTVRTMTLKADGYKIVIIATGGDHANLTPQYAAIKDEMHEVAGFFGKKYLNEVEPKKFFSSVSEIQKSVSGRAILRASHFFDENERVDRAAEAVRKNDLDTFFDMVKKSGESSWKLLQNCYCDTDTEQRIPLALYLCARIMKKGAYRVHGGGFKGTILAFVHESEYKDFMETMSPVFGSENIFVTEVAPYGVKKLNIEH
jgi:galactokinase